MKAHSFLRALPQENNDLKLGQWFQFIDMDQPGSPKSELLDKCFFLAYGRFSPSIQFPKWIYELIDPSGKKYLFDSENKLLKEHYRGDKVKNITNVSSCEIFTLSFEEAKKICGNHGLIIISNVLQIRLSPANIEYSCRHFPYYESINLKEFELRVFQFIQSTFTPDSPKRSIRF